VVEERLGIRRVGLMLIIADAPTGVLAYHEVGSNAIVVNRRHLEPWLRSRSQEEANGKTGRGSVRGTGL
jgi:beta-phosphoglucomutase-like phosphatase (HAD superfamily)